MEIQFLTLYQIYSFFILVHCYWKGLLDNKMTDKQQNNKQLQIYTLQ